ncbi:LAMI_0B08108g1_1 [Lachancea mirantina]|uniref:LAMI_0B08108g1_1 n=1 Tax=Lachancea mirantina TaxID=1230905 RepID=A0A1G4IXN2_9SACH|nr:LAMI_0B08108g1_1 [Lachancea mirantina]
MLLQVARLLPVLAVPLLAAQAARSQNGSATMLQIPVLQRPHTLLRLQWLLSRLAPKINARNPWSPPPSLPSQKTPQFTPPTVHLQPKMLQMLLTPFRSVVPQKLCNWPFLRHNNSLLTFTLVPPPQHQEPSLQVSVLPTLLPRPKGPAQKLLPPLPWFKPFLLAVSPTT